MHRYKKLDIWKRSISLATDIYEVTTNFPAEEKYGLVSQLRRCVVSIGSNIAEGAGRNTNKDFKRFLSIAYASSCELETQLIIAKNLDILPSKAGKILLSEINQLQKMIFTFSKKLTPA
ncbi:four helix bundle protein [Aliifodinibius salipaludis]|uniref:Four helix bundle protein n=1 Tax=Fodinibius salipaludis TaxID=2032627 RepID=A0A2A2GG99_9BACT|nr:four helix bundle protein [Aliifodinibius salipaludis]PAU95885.1 four helix bundle protein [Aliifodinibius salipaludis]